MLHYKYETTYEGLITEQIRIWGGEFMRVFSVNLNNFGGYEIKPVRKGYDEYVLYQEALLEYRNKISYKKNIDAFLDKLDGLNPNPDIIFLSEFDNNSYGDEYLTEKMLERGYEIRKPNNNSKAASITVLFAKTNILEKYTLCNKFPIYQNSIGIILEDIHIVGVKAPINYNDFKEYLSLMVDYFEECSKILYIGDMNVYNDEKRLKVFNMLINKGAIDLWVHKGHHPNTPTFKNGNRLDYVLCSENISDVIDSIFIKPSFYKEKITDHAAIFVDLNI